MADPVKYYVGDLGTVITVSTGNVLTGATTTDLKVQKPDGTEVVWTGTIDPLNNQRIVYTIGVGDFDQSGRYRLQSFVAFPSGSWLGNTAEFTVAEPFR